MSCNSLVLFAVADEQETQYKSVKQFEQILTNTLSSRKASWKGSVVVTSGLAYNAQDMYIFNVITRCRIQLPLPMKDASVAAVKQLSNNSLVIHSFRINTSFLEIFNLRRLYSERIFSFDGDICFTELEDNRIVIGTPKDIQIFTPLWTKYEVITVTETDSVEPLHGSWFASKTEYCIYIWNEKCQQVHQLFVQYPRWVRLLCDNTIIVSCYVGYNGPDEAEFFNYKTGQNAGVCRLFHNAWPIRNGGLYVVYSNKIYDLNRNKVGEADGIFSPNQQEVGEYLIYQHQDEIVVRDRKKLEHVQKHNCTNTVLCYIVE
jgi:hypothetical protein